MGYDQAMQEAGATVLEYKQFGSYQGEWLAVVKVGRTLAIVHDWYGSCSGCDSFEAEIGYMSHEANEGDYHYSSDPVKGCARCAEFKEKLADFGKKYVDARMSGKTLLAWISERVKNDYDSEPELTAWAREKIAKYGLLPKRVMSKLASAVGLLLLLAAACVHPKPKPPSPPTPSPTPVVVVTPTPSPTPAIEFPSPLVWCWGCTGINFESKSQTGWLFPSTAWPRFQGAMLGDQEGRSDSSESGVTALMRVPPYAQQIVDLGGWIVVGFDWADLKWRDGPGYEVESCPLVEAIVDTFAPYWNRVAFLYLTDEAGDTKQMLEARIRFVRKLETARDLKHKPTASGFLESELWALDGHKADDLQIAFTEAYGAEMGSGNRATDAANMCDAIDRQLALLPGYLKWGDWGMEYNRNGHKLDYNTDGGWTQSIEDLAALIAPTAKCERKYADRLVSHASFCDVRGARSNGYNQGGWFDWIDLAKPQQERANVIRTTGTDPGPEVPPRATPGPTPAPTPNPGRIYLYNNTFTYPASAVPYLPINRKDGTLGHVTVDWSAHCETPGPDCPDSSGTTEFVDGKADGAALLTVPAQDASLPGWRYWHIGLSNVTGGALLDDTGGNVQVMGAAPGVSFLLPSSTRGENSAKGWLVRGGDCSAQIDVYYRVDPGTLVTGTDIDWPTCDTTPECLRHWTMPAGQCATPLSVGWNGNAVKGHAGTWTLANPSPPLPIGRVPAMTFLVQ